MADRNKRLLNDLRVIDLRAELEKRNLDKSGVRGVLIQRLSKYLEEEGLDPATYVFDLNATDVKTTPSKRTRKSDSVAEGESEESSALEDMIVQDEGGDDEETLQKEQDKETSQDNSDKSQNMETDEPEKANRKREIRDEAEATEAKKPCLEEKDGHEDDSKTENNIDTEDSINLDLGDDELLNEETEHSVKSKKDEAGNEDATETAGAESAEESAAGTDGVAGQDQQVNAEATATSNDGEKKDDSQTDDKDKENEGEKREGDSREGGARNLWVSGLSGDTRAKDLKQLCSKHGKVICARIVTNARTPGSRCYGYVTMASSQDADNCIKNLHRTELHGRMISVEKAKSESDSSRRQAARSERRPSKERKEDNKEDDKKDGEKTDKAKKEAASGDESRRSSRSRGKSHRSDKERSRRSSRSRERRRSPREVLSFSKIMKERDVARLRERSRAAREQERRRRAAEAELRERERRQRQEQHRLAIEREKLRAEREKIEREKNELLRLERERHRLEREKLELERLELKRAQLRLEEERRKRGYESSTYRKAGSPPPEPAYERDSRHKRPPPPLSSRGSQFEAPPPPRFEVGAGYERADKRDRDRDYKREYPRHVSASSMKYPSNGTPTEDSRQPLPASTRPKEPSRSYESREARPYRPSPPAKPEPRGWAPTARYPDPPAAKTTKHMPQSSSGGGDSWGSTEQRYGSSGTAYDGRYPPAYQPPPPGATYPDRYAATAREYRKY